jgi:hypothetical protein
VHITGAARVSGIPLNQDVAQVVAWRDDMVWRVVAYPVPAEALKAVVLAE